MNFDSFGNEYTPQDILDEIKDKSINRSIFRIQYDDSIMCRFYCNAFMEYMVAEKTLLEYSNLFSRLDYPKNDKKIYKYFKDKYDKKQRKSFPYTEKGTRNKKLSFRRNKTRK